MTPKLQNILNRLDRQLDSMTQEEIEREKALIDQMKDDIIDDDFTWQYNNKTKDKETMVKKSGIFCKITGYILSLICKLLGIVFVIMGILSFPFFVLFNYMINGTSGISSDEYTPLVKLGVWLFNLKV